MELRKIDTLEELRREKSRLRQEADAARALLRRQTVKTMSSGKSAILGSWKATLPVIAVAAAKKFVDRSTDAITAPLEGNATLSSIGEGLKIFQSSESQRWMGLIPILKHLWEKWMEATGSDEAIDEFSVANEYPSQASSPRSQAAASAEPVGTY